MVQVEESLPLQEFVWYRGNGKITINKRDIDDYFGLDTLKVIVRQPLTLTSTISKFDVIATVEGGGFTGSSRCYPSRYSKSIA